MELLYLISFHYILAPVYYNMHLKIRWETMSRYNTQQKLSIFVEINMQFSRIY